MYYACITAVLRRAFRKQRHPGRRQLHEDATFERFPIRHRARKQELAADLDLLEKPPPGETAGAALPRELVSRMRPGGGTLPVRGRDADAPAPRGAAGGEAQPADLRFQHATAPRFAAKP